MENNKNILLEVSHVSKTYEKHRALKDVSLSVPRGTIYGLLGPNGAGKTSLIRIITQIVRADKGEVYFDGETLQPKHTTQIGYLPEERGLYKKMKVGEQLMYLGRLRGLQKSEVQQQLKYWMKTFEMQTWWDKKIEDLSKGMQQKVQFVATVLHNPKLLILDEPFSGFDPINANLIKDEILKLKAKGITIIFSTHRMESVEELCDYISLIHHSEKVIEGKKIEIKQQFRNNTYMIHTNKPIASPDNSLFEIISESQQADGLFYETKLHLMQGTSNDLLRMLINDYEVHALQELIPSMNDIFISLVQNRPQDAILS
ncbi:MAG: ATP-binding cassette domain-containing protein [Bernardetiaceae bacterium]|nr:ATP-binding cassette domain-containing protein [Bernardetiaceae bacterium]